MKNYIILIYFINNFFKISKVKLYTFNKFSKVSFFLKNHKKIILDNKNFNI